MSGEPGEAIHLLWKQFPALGGLMLGLGGFTIYYNLLVAKKVALDCKDGSKFQRFLSNNMGTVSERYFPTFWCFESRMQTFMAPMFRHSLPNNNYRREVLRMDDGGEVALDWLEGDANDKGRPTVVFLPGLTGHSQSCYMKAFVNIAREVLDARCVVLNHRGLGGSTFKTPRICSAVFTEDIAQVLDHVKELDPDSPVMAMGVSLGSLILGNYLKEVGDAARDKLVAVFVLSCPFDCVSGIKSLERWGLNRLLSRNLAGCLNGVLSKVKEVFRPFVDVDRALKSTTVREFDASFTSVLFGYRDVWEYYTDASISGHLHKIKVPYLSLNAEDDIFQPGISIPSQEVKECNNPTAIMKTKYGGHIAFLEGWMPTGRSFAERVFAEYITAVFNNVSNRRLVL